MEMHCISCKKYTGNENSIVRKTKQNRLILISNCAVSGKKKLPFIKNKELHSLMINLKWIKSLTSFYWLETNLCQNWI